MTNQLSKYNAKIILPARLDFSAALRDFTLAAVKNIINLDTKWAYRLQLVVDEIYMNAVRYGSAPEESVTIEFKFSPEKLIIEISDTGTGSESVKAADLRATISKAKERHLEMLAKNEINFDLNGRGLSQIATAWADQLEFKDQEDGGILVRITKYL